MPGPANTTPQILDTIVWRPDSPPDVDARFRGLPSVDAPPDYFRVWLWNLTNLAEVRQGAKPRMAEVGPLTYRKYRLKLDAWWDRRGRVSVKEWDYHIFQPHLSSANPNDTITTINLPLLGVLELLHAYGSAVPAVQTLIDVLLGVLSGWRDRDHVDGLFMHRKAAELLWGYDDLLLQRLQLLLGSSFVPYTTVRLLQNDTSAEQVIANQVASVIDTGWRPEEEALGAAANPRMEVEQGWRAVSSWGPNCSEPVRGTDAFQFAPGVTRGSVLRVWITELFRSAVLLFKEEVELHGVRMLRFEPDPAESAPDVCHRQRIRGMANVTAPTAVGPTGNGSSPAAHGVPILMSLPHYCLVDDAVAGALEGVACDLPTHATFIDVEPNTGITMRAAKRLQLSSEITDSARATLEPGLRNATILPVFWAEEASQISPEQGAAFAATVYAAQRLAARLAAVGYPAATVLALVAAAAAATAVLHPRGGPTAAAEAGSVRDTGANGHPTPELTAPLLGDGGGAAAVASASAAEVGGLEDATGGSRGGRQEEQQQQQQG
ncbi:hypothetical protein GPECTOR_162g133 [Gonium pectorale]|uniref:Uncharacterized protein n=1 Tax=Gonium pectorale TaxID=33097 RepID=A0A150FXK5_GONPE|nr:hypothetical protein GPECTOR_162g133 [Gonium pectorale]|eukprot:KXZ42318.1 hypothetical protein GPECTOR_162g133 [Gonium pectorale]